MTRHAPLRVGDEDAVMQVSAALRLADELCEPCALYDVVVTQMVEVASDNDVHKQIVVVDFGVSQRLSI